MTAKERFRKAALKLQEGCPLFEGRELCDMADVEGEVLHLDDAYPMTGENGLFYVVTFEEYPAVYFFSGKALTAILDEASDVAADESLTLHEVISGTAVSIQAPIKTKSGRKFRPVTLADD